MKKQRPLYELVGCSKEELLKYLELLTEEESEILEKKTSNNIDNAIIKERMTNQENAKYYGAIIPKLKKLHKRAQKQSKLEQCPRISENPQEEEKKEEAKKIEEKKEFQKEDYQQILQFLKSPNYQEIISILTPKQGIIFMLKTGYIDNKYFESEAIAKFLEISKEEVENEFQKSLILYQKKINEVLDKAIEKMQEYSKDSSEKKSLSL